MAQLKRKSSWCVPSFDCEPASKTLVKRTSKGNENLFDKSFTQDSFKKVRHETSLSKLLEACEPQKSSELAISKQKQKEITDWFQCGALRGQPSMLILSGPSGCGKTAAIKLLAKENGFDVIEWITPIDPAEDENKHIMRQGDRFEDHLIRATRYHTVLGSCSKQLLLVKDLPNVYQEDHKAFFALLENYFQIGKQPVIFVCTETGNSRLMQTLFAPAIREKFGIRDISVNAATQTSIKNVLKRVSNILNTVASDMLHVSQHHIDEILSNSIGDVRSAVLNLIFISLKVPGRHLKSDCGLRGETLGLLRGIGRVTNPKSKIRFYLQIASNFHNLFLQENYLNTIRTLEEASVASDILSLAEVFNSEWRDRNLGKVALSYCIRGLMLANEKPVTAWNPVRKPRDTQNIRRCLITAEKQWYESIIKPSSVSKESEKISDEDTEMTIVED
ncbi:cell cycle checkpoint protein RAD17 isoform X2 [Pseudomyrmex gracilis]|uniref:cell cycle checkpoint protein RAD17 isoform X2 n=1 Tax=Pseudomyrmex gracilis TaxID=219809 RepID=UPI000995C580|nr:cell cycle checkpoint protein RAD17 isoform X2 [Pseudomyrmex gracilis]